MDCSTTKKKLKGIPSLFLQLPELVQDEILSQLSLTEWLKLRTVCKTANSWIESRTEWPQIKDTCYLSVEEEGSRSLKKLVKGISGLFPPQNKLHNFRIVNKTAIFFEQPAIPIFLQCLAQQIHKLSICTMTHCTLNSEYTFFESLENLQELHIECIRPIGKSDGTAAAQGRCDLLPRVTETNLRLPENCTKNLEILKLDFVHWKSSYHLDLIDKCGRMKLKFLRLPKMMEPPRSDLVNDFDVQEHRERLRCLIRIIQEQQNGSIGSNLKTIDLGNVKLHLKPQLNRFPRLQFSELEYEFIHVAVNAGIKLMNVPEVEVEQTLDVLESRYGSKTVEKFAKNVLKLNGVSESLIGVDLPRLEEFRCTEISDRLMGEEKWKFGGWPRLRKICVRLTSGGDKDVVQKLVDFLFRGPKARNHVEEIEWTFPNSQALTIQPYDFIGNFPNLKSLTLAFDGFSKEDLSLLLKLLGELRKLERLSLNSFDTSEIGDGVFWGENEEVPLLLQLTRLKDFTMRLQGRSGVTDESFKRVFSRMKLIRFGCIGRGFMNITHEGLKALANGEFGTSIEEFDFRLIAVSNKSLPEQRLICHEIDNITALSFKNSKK